MKKLIFKFVFVIILSLNSEEYTYTQTSITQFTATASSFVNVGDPVPNGNSTVAFPPANVLDGISSTTWLTWASSAWLQISLPIPNAVAGIEVYFQAPWQNCKVQFLLNGVLLSETSIAEYLGGSTFLKVPSNYTGPINQIKIVTDRFDRYGGLIPIGIGEVKLITEKISGITATSGNITNPIISGAEKAVDGNAATYWQAPSSSWLQVNLPSQPYQISGMQINFGPPCIDYKVQLFSVGGNVLETIENTNPSLHTQTLTILPTYTGAVSHIKINPTMVANMNPFVYEVDLYGAIVPPPINYSFSYDDRGNCTSRPLLGGGVKSASVKNNPAPKETKDVGFLKLYPNPTNDFLTIEFSTFDDQVPGSLSVVDITGRLVYFSDVLTKRYTIDLSNKTTGQYILIYQSGDDKKSWNILKN